jgi:hypothetical protein
MLLVSAVLAAVVKIRLLPVLLLGVLLSHARLMVLACGALAGFVVAERLSRRRVVILMGLMALVGALIHAFLTLHSPTFLVSVLSSQSLASDFVARWYPAFLSLFGAAIALMRRDRLDRLAVGWAGAVILIVLLADCGPLRFVGTADRMLLVLYLPLSLLAAIALSMMGGEDPKTAASFMLVLIVTGAATMGVVFSSYAGSWGIPQEDHDAIMWLSGQNLSDAFCINMDETGAWVYPMTGIWATSPRGLPTDSTYGLRERVAKGPDDKKVLDVLRGIRHEDILIYISSVSIIRPGYVPPFAEYISVYPEVNLSFSQENYELLYDRGTRIYRLIR